MIEKLPDKLFLSRIHPEFADSYDVVDDAKNIRVTWDKINEIIDYLNQQEQK